jgi:rhamnosyltransferase subunit B
MLVLALFPPAFAERQPDWPPQTVQTGFAFYDGNRPNAELPALAKFLAGGEASIVSPLGSTAVSHPGNFFQATGSVRGLC